MVPSKPIIPALFRISFIVSTAAFARALPAFIPYFAPGFSFSYFSTFVMHSPGSLHSSAKLKRDTLDTSISSSASPEVSDVSARGFPWQTSCNCPKISEIAEYDRGQSWDNFVAKEQAVFRAAQPRSSVSQSASSCNNSFEDSANSSGSLAWTCNQFGHNASSKKHWKADNAMPWRPWRSTRSLSTECWSGTRTA